MKKTIFSLVALTVLVFTVSTSAMATDPYGKNGLVILTPEEPEQMIELTLDRLNNRISSPVENITVVTMGKVGNLLMEFSASGIESEDSWYAPANDIVVGFSVAGPKGKSYYKLSLDESSVYDPETITVPINRSFSYLNTGTVLLQAPELSITQPVTLRVIIRIDDSYCGGCV
jgi:hypothetical protein